MAEPEPGDRPAPSHTALRPATAPASPTPPQERLWLTEPRRATCLATVTGVRGDAVTVDRALFAPRSRALRHPQPADKGTVWLQGEKRRLAGVEERGGRVWYTVRGVVPPAGSELQCELDAEARDDASRAHTALHLLLAAARKLDAPPMTADPEVRGGGHARLTFAWPLPPPALKELLQFANSWVEADRPVQRAFATRAEADRHATRQDFQPPDPVPGGDVVPLVRVEGVCVHPCDGTHADRTGRLGRIVIAHAAAGREGFVVVGRVE